MKRRLISTILLPALLLGFCALAEARSVIGFSTADIPLDMGKATRAEMEALLEKATADDVVLRSFDDTGSLTSWLLRFQEVDFALFSKAFYAGQPAGSYLHLADLHQTNTTAPRLVLVSRQGVDPLQRDEMRQAFLGLSQTSRGATLLKNLGIAGISQPGAARPKTRPTPPPAPTPAPAPKPVAKPAAAPKPQPPMVMDQKPTPAPKPTVATKPAPDAAPPRETVRSTPDQPDKGARPEPVTDSPAPETKPLETAPATGPKATEPPAVPKPAASAAPPSEEIDSIDAKRTRTRLYLFAAMVVLAAIALKLWLIFRRLEHKKKPVTGVEPAPGLDVLDTRIPLRLQTNHPTLSKPATPPPVVTPPAPPATDMDKPFADTPLLSGQATETSSPAPMDEDAIEAGDLGPGQVPLLLKRCAEMPEPVILEIHRGSFLKRIHFAAGQIAHATPWRDQSDGTHRHENKLSYLLVREGIISETEKDQALEYLEEHPEIRLGDALLKLKLIDLAELRHALTRQAKLEVYSLILFPQGEYRIRPDDGSLSAEESVSLEITSLLRDASHHKAEWTAIRKELPSLDTALAMPQGSGQKLDQVRMSVHQQLILSNVDGRKSLYNLCTASTMMDYEVYRFVYLMLKAGVLQRA